MMMKLKFPFLLPNDDSLSVYTQRLQILMAPHESCSHEDDDLVPMN